MRKILQKPYRFTVKIAKKITDLDQVITENQNLKKQNSEIINKIKSIEKNSNFGWPKGHYYSPVHNLADLSAYKKVINRSKSKFADNMPSFSEKRIINEFNEIAHFFNEFDYPKVDDGNCRFYVDNVSLSTLDALFIFSIIRKHKPKKIIEIGSGFSSGLMMEVNEKYFNNKIDITFIEPYPDLLYQRMHKDDKSRYKVISKGVQDVPLGIFKNLGKDDILFIDSSHVSKFNSDVNYEIFDILPVLNKGVIIHFHDIHDGFEYPLNWLQIGWAWNEAYILRAYLMNNREYKVLLMANYLVNRFPKLLSRFYIKDDVMQNGWIKHDGSLWLRKI